MDDIGCDLEEYMVETQDRQWIAACWPAAQAYHLHSRINVRKKFFVDDIVDHYQRDTVRSLNLKPRNIKQHRLDTAGLISPHKVNYFILCALFHFQFFSGSSSLLERNTHAIISEVKKSGNPASKKTESNVLIK